MNGIDISNINTPEFGPLSIKFNYPLTIDKDEWNDILKYIWSNLVCYNTFKNIIKNWKTGFSLYINTYEKDPVTKRYFLPNKNLQISNKKLQHDELMLNNLKQQLKNLKNIRRLFIDLGIY